MLYGMHLTTTTWELQLKIICDQWGLTREELDKFAADSQQKSSKSSRRRKIQR